MSKIEHRIVRHGTEGATYLIRVWSDKGKITNWAWPASWKHASSAEELIKTIDDQQAATNRPCLVAAEVPGFTPYFANEEIPYFDEDEDKEEPEAPRLADLLTKPTVFDTWNGAEVLRQVSADFTRLGESITSALERAFPRA